VTSLYTAGDIGNRIPPALRAYTPWVHQIRMRKQTVYLQFVVPLWQWRRKQSLQPFHRAKAAEKAVYLNSCSFHSLKGDFCRLTHWGPDCQPRHLESDRCTVSGCLRPLSRKHSLSRTRSFTKHTICDIWFHFYRRRHFYGAFCAEWSLVHHACRLSLLAAVTCKHWFRVFVVRHSFTDVPYFGTLTSLHAS